MSLCIFYFKNIKIHYKIILETNLFYVFISVSSTKHVFIFFIFIIFYLRTLTKHRLHFGCSKILCLFFHITYSFIY